MRIYKKDIDGNWLQLVNRDVAAGNAGTTPFGVLNVRAPADPETTVTLQIRPRDGSGGRVKKILMPFGDAYRYDADLAAGGAM